MFNRFRWVFLFLFCFSPLYSVQAQTSQGAEIISYNTFGEGLMVTKAKMAPISGTVNNIFFYNRVDEPWNGNVWYEYDWEIRGAHPFGGWSQIRVREENGGVLKDAPINVTMLENLSYKFLHYVLIRQDNMYVYDVREDFDINTYDFNIAEAHEGNSSSILDGGARIFFTGAGVADIPEEQRLDFSLGLTSFDSNWAGRLPGEAYSGDYAVDFTRFYEFDDNDELIKTPQWFDEFNAGSLDYSKWFPATWDFADTLFTTENLRFENGYVVFRANRGQVETDISEINLASTAQATQSSTVEGGEASRAIDGVVDGQFINNSVIQTEDEANAWWELELDQTSDLDQIVIYNRTDVGFDTLADFTISILDEEDNVVWTQFYTDSLSSVFTVNLDAIGKKIRINLNGVLSIAEVEVFGTPPQNVALTGTASQSTTDWGGIPERAIDGITNGVWRGQIVIYNRTDRCCSSRLANFTVSVLDDEENVIWSELYSDSPAPSLTIDLSVTGSTVRVSQDGVLSLAEVQVFDRF